MKRWLTVGSRTSVKGGKFHCSLLQIRRRYLSYGAFLRTEFQLPTLLLGKLNDLFHVLDICWRLVVGFGRCDSIYASRRLPILLSIQFWFSHRYFVVGGGGVSKQTVSWSFTSTEFTLKKNLPTSSRSIVGPYGTSNLLNVGPFPTSHQI